MKIEEGFRLRFHIPNTEKQRTVKVKKVWGENGKFRIDTGEKKIRMRSEVYLTGISDIRFPSKIEEQNGGKQFAASQGFKRKILSGIKFHTKPKREEIYFRINSLEWMKKIHLNEVDGLFLSFSKILWRRFDPGLPFVKKFIDRIFIEFPKFIKEDSLSFYSELADKMFKYGIRNFVISHLSQKLLIPKGCCIFANENVYVFNDAAAAFLKKKGISNFSYPQEIDFVTLFSLSHRDGIVPVYFHRELFHSRMPVTVKVENETLKDDNKKLQRFRRNGITSIVPEIPVAIFHSRNKLNKNGFYRYLIDLSYESPSKNRAKTLKRRLFKSEQIQPSNSFNFVKGLK